MKFNHLLLIGTLFFFSFSQAQEQLKYSFSVDKNNTEILNIIKDALGESSATKKGKVFWLKKTSSSKYKISVKDRKIKIFYKGNDEALGRKIRKLHTEIKD